VTTRSIKWLSFTSEPKPGCVTLNTFFKRAHDMGWKGTVRDSAAEMFKGVGASAASDTAPEARRSLRDRRVNAASLAGKPVPERQWLVPNWIPMEQVTLIYGDGAVGKSLGTLQLGVASATETLWFDQPVKAGPAEYITAEDSEGELHRRLDDIARGTKQPLETMGALNVSSFADEDAIMAALNGEGKLVETDFYREVEAVVKEAKPVLLVLDTLADIYGGNEIIRAQARAFVNMLRKIAIKYHLAVVVLAHPSLDGIRSGKGTSGSTGWSNSVRSRLYWERIYDLEGSEPDTNARVLKSMKMNYGSANNEIHMHWKNGVFVVDVFETRDDPMSQQWKADRIFLELLDRANEHNAHVSGSLKANNYAPKAFVRDALKRGIKKGQLVDAMARLLDSGKIENAPFGPHSRVTYRLQRTHKPTETAPPL
jgi:RecA-family ATPase